MADLLKVKDIAAFCNVLKSVTKIVPDAQFEVDSQGCKIKVVNESQTIRAYFTTDAVKCNKDITFSFRDIVNLKKSLELIERIEERAECELKITESFITYSDKVTFKLKLVKPEIIERYVTKDITTQLNKVFKYTTTINDIKQVLQCSGIVSDPSTKLYMSENGGNVLCEIDDKNNAMSNSVGIPIADSIDGSIVQPVMVALENFQLFTVLEDDNISVTYTDKNVLEIRSSNVSTSLYMISTTLKG